MCDYIGTWKRPVGEGADSATVVLILRDDGSYTKRLHALAQGQFGGAHEGTWMTRSDQVHLSGDDNWPAYVEDMKYFEKVDGDVPEFPPPPGFQDESFVSEMEKVAAMMQLDRRYRAATGAIDAAAPHDVLLEELYSVQFGYEELLHGQPATYQLYTAIEFRRKIAETQHSIACVFEAKHDLPNAMMHFESAAQKYAKLGDAEKAGQTRSSINLLRALAEKEMNAELALARSLLLRASPRSLERATALVEVGELEAKTGRELSADETLRLALTELRELGSETPEAALTSTAQALRAGSAAPGRPPLERLMAVRGLVARANLALAQLCQRSGRSDEQAKYFAEAEIYSASLSPDFAEKILQAFFATFAEKRN